jgi:hypothetical protein
VALEPRFAPMIERVEPLAADSPRSHDCRVLAAGMLGYAVRAGILLLFVGLVIGIVAFLVSHPGAAAGGIKLLIPIGTGVAVCRGAGGAISALFPPQSIAASSPPSRAAAPTPWRRALPVLSNAGLILNFQSVP